MTAPVRGSFDARPLHDPVDPAAVRAFAAELRARRTTSTSASTMIGIVVAVLAGLVLVPLLATTVIGLAVGGRDTSPLAVLPLLLIGGALVAIVVFSVAGWRRARETRYRLNLFAGANGMSYLEQVADPPLPGMIFGLGRARRSSDLLRGTTPRFVEFGNYQYTVGSGKNSTTHRWGYVAVKLDVPLPNIVLDAKGNNAFGTNLPASFDRHQRLSLEGDFDRYFTLYCPAGYERDALYLFTPDIMARFIDNAAELDVEIVDDWLFLYTQRRVSTLDPATWAWLFGAVGALIVKFDQWARWRDERFAAEQPTAAATASAMSPRPLYEAPSPALPFAPPAGMLTPPPGVAPQGRRLTKRVQWLPILLAVGIGVAWTIARVMGNAGH
ncbi:MAG: hypothetical protein J7484_01990 [Microbacterium sp.]|nr:hypothetical protein [Microbacterium sp.]